MKMAIDLRSSEQCDFENLPANVIFKEEGLELNSLCMCYRGLGLNWDAATVWCDARATARGWYIKRGLVPFGPTFYKRL
jgi:hypothetical protein